MTRLTRTKINGTIKNVKETSVIPVFASLLLIITVAVPVSVVSVLISSVWESGDRETREMQRCGSSSVKCTVHAVMYCSVLYCACSMKYSTEVYFTCSMQYCTEVYCTMYMQHAVLY